MNNPDIFNTFVAIDIVPITPSDTVDLPTAARAIRCRSGGGTLRITTLSGQVRNTSIDVGEMLLVAALRVHATGTTATGLEAMI
jgi:hypothetical protein